jgi:hypothetical protein
MTVSDRTKAANLGRAFAVAGQIVAASPDLADASPTDTAAAVGELAAAIYAEENALFEGESLGDVAPAKSSGGGKSWGGGGSSSGGDGVTPKQVGFAKSLIEAIQNAGGTVDVDIDDIKGLSKSDASDTISKLKEQRDELEAF